MGLKASYQGKEVVLGIHATPEAFKEAIIELLKSRYSDFGPL
jgi:hypothetical protein